MHAQRVDSIEEEILFAATSILFCKGRPILSAAKNRRRATHVAKVSVESELVMPRIRLFLLWLIVAAIPLQGLAAASMLFCGTGAHHAPSQAIELVDGGAIVSTGSHDHAKHSHGDAVEVKKATEDTGKKLPGAEHKCPVCSSCCHSVAITDFPTLVSFAPLPQSETAEPFVLIQPRPSSVPDKPPRA